MSISSGQSGVDYFATFVSETKTKNQTIMSPPPSKRMHILLIVLIVSTTQSVELTADALEIIS